MIADVGRSPCVITAPNGEQFAFFNSQILNKDTVSYYEERTTEAKYQLVYSEVEQKLAYRALHYSRFYTNGALDSVPRVVPSVYDNDNGSIASALYETITPCIGNIPGKSGAQLMFWTNLQENSNTLETNDLGAYVYDPNKILRFENDKLDDVDVDDYSIKLLCSALITWERLKASGGLANDTNYVTTPLIRDIYILAVQSGNIAIDFSSGGGGGGMRVHNHADNNNCGFAFAVFAPGTALEQINWS